MRRTSTLLLALTLALQACTYPFPQPTSTASTPTPVAGEAETQAALPRVTVEEAKAALDSGQAVIIDVRSVESFAASHIKGAVSIPLNEIEGAPNRVTYAKSQWIITYCT